MVQTDSTIDTILYRPIFHTLVSFLIPIIGGIVVGYLVKEKGYTLQGAKEALKTNSFASSDTIEIVDSLKKLKGFLIELKNQLP